MLIRKPWDFEAVSLGEHIKRSRLKRGWLLKEVGALFGVSMETVINWEKGITTPEIRHMTGVISFLGYNPLPPPEERTLGNLLWARRRELGLTHKAAAKVMGVSPDTVLYWENEGKNPMPQLIPRIIEFLGCNPFPPGMRTIAELLKARRRELGMTQYDAATKFDVWQGTYSQWEQGGLIRSPKKHKIIAEFLGVSEEEVRMAVGEKRRIIVV